LGPVSVWDGYHVRFDHVAQELTSVGRLCLTTLQPQLHSSLTSPALVRRCQCSHLLDGIITSGSRFSAFSSRFSRLRTSRPGGDDAVSLTIEAVELDDTCPMRYHRININLQLLKNSRCPFFTAHPPALLDRFRANESHQIVPPEWPSSAFFEDIGLAASP